MPRRPVPASRLALYFAKEHTVSPANENRLAIVPRGTICPGIQPAGPHNVPRGTFWAACSTALLLLPCLLLPGCSLIHPVHVTTGYDHSVPFAQRTWSWGEFKMAAAGYDLPVRTAITKELAKRGWQYVATGGNTTVFVWGDIQSQAQLDGDYDKYGQGWVAPVWGLQGLGSGWAKDEYGQLTHIALMKPGNNLVVDIFDTASHRLLVRAVGEDDLESTQKNNAKRLEKTIHKMLNQVPKG
jgi:hypothetical protein